MRRIRMYEIARLSNVSIGTVGRALNGKGRISEETRQSVLRVAKELGYKPNLAARALSVKKGLRVGVCIPRELHFFYDQIRRGILGEARNYEYLGLDLIYRPVDRLGRGENEKVQELLKRDIQALILTPGDPEKLTPFINLAEQQGIRVVCVATDAPDSCRSSVVCVDPETNGRLAGELLGKLLQGESQVAVFTGMLHTEDHRKKVKGFSEVLPQTQPGARVTEVLEGHEDEDETFKKCVDLLHRVRKLQGIYVSTVNCLPVCRALSSLGLAGKIKLITTDLFREMAPYFQKGTITASIYQRPYVQGQAAIRMVADHFATHQPIQQAFYLNPNIVMLSNLALFREMREVKIADGTSLSQEPALMPY